MHTHSCFALATLVAVAGSACAPTPPATPDPGPPFEPASPAAQVAKVKDLLVGEAPTEDEVKQVIANPGALRSLVVGWMALPQYRERMLVFFRGAFQQEQISDLDFMEQLPASLRNFHGYYALIRGLQESFARTAWQLAANGEPFTGVITTRSFMLTPPLLSLLAYIDSVHLDDDAGLEDATINANPSFSITLHSSGQPIDIAQTLDPGSPLYMHWNNSIGVPSVVNGIPNAPDCLDDPRTYPTSSMALLEFLFGILPEYLGCPNQYYGASQFSDAEFDDWKMVRIRQPQPGEATTRFYDVPTLNTTTELVAHVPRVGFFTTPAFFANWQTNASNQARVTMNQTLIVALGSSFDGANVVVPVAETGLDSEHAAPGTTCYACHHTLDPMRQYFRQAFTLFYHDQWDPIQSQVPGVFAFDGVSVQGTVSNGIFDLADELASHPRFATAWALKVCFWANSAPCSEDDPELQSIANFFKVSGFDWNVLVREMLVSPLVTSAFNTKTFEDRDVVVSVARRARLCGALSDRMGITDLCGLTTDPPLSNLQLTANALSLGVPDDGYSRGAVDPVLATDPSLVFSASTENLCGAVADAVIDGPPATTRYDSHAADLALDDFVARVMGITPVDDRSKALRGVLSDHYGACLDEGLSATDALKSTFVLACASPTSVTRGL